MAAPARRTRGVGAVLLAILAAGGLALLFVAYRTIEAERAERAQVQRTVRVLDDLRMVGSAALNAETGQRGYMLTLDRRYLAPYLAGSERIGPALERLRASLGPDATARQRALLDEIDALTRAKFSEMDQTVEMVGAGQLIEARRAILTDEGQETMERLRRAIRELESIEAAVLRDASADAAAKEGRVIPILGALLVVMLLAMIGGLRLLALAARAEAEAAQAAALAEARDRADLLARELNHRVKNLFAVILAIIQMGGRNRPEAREVTDTIAQRIHALLRAHEVTQGSMDNPVGPLRKLVETTLAPYLSATHRAEIDGEELMLPAKLITPLGLVLHELATNAVKYGAWTSGGTVAVRWRVSEGRVRLVWEEDNLAISEEPAGKGFGTMLMTSAGRQLGGTIERRFAPGTMTATIEFPAP